MENVSSNEEVLLTCTLVINSEATPSSEPTFTVTMSEGSMVEIINVSLVVASERSVEWEIIGPKEFNVGESASIKVEIVNTGNVRLTHTLQIAGPKGWQISSDDADAIFDLEAGQSDSVELTIIASDAGNGELLLWLSNADNVESSSTTIMVSSSGLITDISSSESGTSNIIGVIGLLIISFLVGLLIIQIRAKISSKNTPSPNYPKIPPNFGNTNTVNVVENNQQQELKEYHEQAEKYAQYQIELAEYEQKMQQYEGEANQITSESGKTPENNEVGVDSTDDETMTDSDES